MAQFESIPEKDMQNALSEESFQFLAELEKHTSDKAWFEGHKTAYQKYVHDPLYELAEQLGPVMLALDAISAHDAQGWFNSCGYTVS